MNNIADLHLHSTFSDGACTPEEIVNLAKEENLEAIAISDHDAFGGIEPAIFASDGTLKVIPAVELSTEINGYDLHILGYFVDYKDSELVEEVEKFRDVRDSRAEKIVKNLKKMGVTLEYTDVKEIAGDGAVGRPHIARALEEAGYVKNQPEAFHRFLGYNSPAYVPKFKIHPNEAFRLISEAGGIPVWAHPGYSSKTNYLLQEFVKNGLMGIEVYHPNHEDWVIQKYIDFVEDYNLVITGGTDFHGREVDVPLGKYGITRTDLEKLEEKAEYFRKINWV